METEQLDRRRDTALPQPAAVPVRVPAAAAGARVPAAAGASTPAAAAGARVPAAQGASTPAAAPGSRAPSRSGTVLALQARALAHERFGASATAVVTELALLLGCERVSLGFVQHGRVRLHAMSNTADIRARQNLVRAIAAAMDEALDSGGVIVHPLPPGASPTISLAHAELSRANQQASICTVPIGGRGRALGALLFERRDGFDPRAVEVAKDVATFVGPILELKLRLDAPLGGRIVEAVAPRGRRRLGVRAAVAATLALGIGIAAAWPVTYHVVAPARVEGAVQRVLAAPVDGFVQAAPLRPGAAVSAGQLLVALEDRDLALERDRWSAESAQLDKQYRDALTRDDAAQIVIARSKLEQAQAQLELVLRQLERTQLKAPIDGVLIAGDLSQSIGMPVKRGQELLTVAPDKSFRIVAQVDEQDVAALREGQRARVMFAALGRPLPFTLARVSPVASAVEGRNVFEVEGRIEHGVDALRPGLSGVARIDVDERALGVVYWQRLSAWLRRTSWRLLG